MAEIVISRLRLPSYPTAQTHLTVAKGILPLSHSFIRFVDFIFFAIFLCFGWGAQASPSDRWLASAMELTPSVNELLTDTYALTIWGDTTRAAAEAGALAGCRKNSKHPENCRTHGTFREGCHFYSGGESPWGVAGFGYGHTPQEAYDACSASKTLNCRKPLGTCVDPSQPPPAATLVLAPRVKYWGALAAGTYHGGGRNLVSIASAPGATKEAAEQKAVRLCNHTAPGITIACQPVGAFNSGCGYLASGVNERTGKLGWRRASKVEDAVQLCTADGFSDCAIETKGLCINE